MRSLDPIHVGSEIFRRRNSARRTPHDLLDDVDNHIRFTEESDRTVTIGMTAVATAGSGPYDAKMDAQGFGGWE